MDEQSAGCRMDPGYLHPGVVRWAVETGYQRTARAMGHPKVLDRLVAHRSSMGTTVAAPNSPSSSSWCPATHPRSRSGVQFLGARNTVRDASSPFGKLTPIG